MFETPADPASEIDPRRRFVRVTGTNAQGFVEFEFAIGLPELCVELMLPPQAFDAFCAAQGVERLDDGGRDARPPSGS